MADNGPSTKRRVKLYMLNEERQWDDKGTGHVSSKFVESLNGIALHVVSEADGSILLESRIQSDTAYQKQQDTLIVWSDAEAVDLALSFQERDGCDEIWGKICSVQGKDPSVEITQEVVEEEKSEECDDTESESGGSLCGLPAVSDNNLVQLPPCEVGWLDDLVSVVASPTVLSIVGKRERLVSSLLRQGYLKRVCTDLFRQAEEASDLKSLNQLHEVIRNVFFLNDKSLFEVMFSDDVIMDVIGILEYDPAKPAKASHREFLLNRSHHRDVLSIQRPDLRSKIHQTYRVQYIQDCILPTPSMFDDNQFSELSSFLFVNKVSILTAVNSDEKLMLNLFVCLRDKTNSLERRLELTLFLKELCNFSCLLEAQDKDLFFQVLMHHQALECLSPLYSLCCTQLRSAVTDILFAFVDHSPVLLRDHMLKEVGQQEQSQLLINVLIQQMCTDPDPEMGDALRLAGLIRALIDPESMINSQPANMYSRSAAEKTEFLRFFYQRAMPTLLEPLYTNTHEERPGKDGYRTAQLLYHILDLLAFCIEQHTYHVKNLVLVKDLIRRVLVLLHSRHSFLVLGALKLFRRIVGLKDEFYNRYLTKNALFRPVIELLTRNGPRYNLINSAVIELVEFINTEGIASLIQHVIENHWEVLRDIHYVNTFRAMHQRYEQIRDKKRGSSSPNMRDISYSMASMQQQSATNTGYSRTGGGGSGTGGAASGLGSPAAAAAALAYRIRRDPRALDQDEENWFDADDDEQPNASVSASPLTSPTSSGASAAAVAGMPLFPTLAAATAASAADKDEDDDSASASSRSSPSPSASSTSGRPLVDYPDDHDDSDEDAESGASSSTEEAEPLTPAAATAGLTIVHHHRDVANISDDQHPDVREEPDDESEDEEDAEAEEDAAPAAKRLRTDIGNVDVATADGDGETAKLPSMMETYAMGRVLQHDLDEN